MRAEMGGFQDGGYFSRSLKRKRVSNHALTTNFKPYSKPSPNLIILTLSLKANSEFKLSIYLNYLENPPLVHFKASPNDNYIVIDNSLPYYFIFSTGRCI